MKLKDPKFVLTIKESDYLSCGDETDMTFYSTSDLLDKAKTWSKEEFILVKFMQLVHGDFDWEHCLAMHMLNPEFGTGRERLNNFWGEYQEAFKQGLSVPP